MRFARSQYNYGYHVSRDDVENIPGNRAFYYQAIENAGGVPFQVIFGPRIGEGYYLNLGDGIRQLFGVAPEDFTERLFYEMIEEIVPLSDEISADSVMTRRKFISGKVKSYKAEVLVRTGGDERKWIRDASLPLIDEETGRVIGAFGILFDITDSKLNLEKLSKIRQKEDEFDSLKASFLHNISHEIRTPLNAIVGFSSLIGEHPDSPERCKEYLDIITSNSDHLLEIIENIVEISKIEAGTVKININKVNLNAMLRKVYDHFWVDTSRKGVQLSFAAALADGEADINTDDFKLTQVLRNLVGNALKFTGEGKVEFGYSIKDKKIEFYVSDTGTGIPEEHQASVFRMFYQADTSYTRTYGGTGLGLAISKAYVEMLGGEIWFTSHPGEGSVFLFTLPYEGVGEI